MNNLRLPLSLFAASLLTASVLCASDWPMWGGSPSRNMVSTGKGLPMPEAIAPGKFLPKTETIDPKSTKSVRWVTKLSQR
jgi:hypothetical protein